MKELNDIQRVVKFLATWVAEIRFFNAVDFYDINRVAENVAFRLLNLVFKLELKNLNEEKKNFPGVDLGDDSRKIAFQVTSENTPQKIKNSLDKFVNGPHLRFTNGIRFFIVNNKKPDLSKDKYDRICPGFDPDEHILTDTDLMKEIEKIYHYDKERFQEILKYLEDEFGHGGKSDGIKSLMASSKVFYENLRGPNGRFRYLKISDILLPGTKSQWLETNVGLDELDEKSQDATNEKFYGGPGGGFSKEPPGRRRQNKLTIFEVLPKLWGMEVKHAVIVGDGGMGKTVSLIHWWGKILESGGPVKPVPVFIALNEFNQVKEIKREDFIVNYVVENYGKEGGGPVTAEQVKKIMKTPLCSGEDFIPSVVLLLDGFNEITVEKRELLLELNHLTERFPGIQVVITSRYDMRGNFNWSHWHPVKLKELEDEQVEGYLREWGTAGTAVPGKSRLWDLIKNPMMLTLFAATCEVQVKHRDSRYCSFKDKVEAPGELLWNFIEAQVALLPDKVGPDEERVFYYWFLLKYLLPSLGFEMEKAGLFAFTYSQFRHHMDNLCLRFSKGDFLDTVPQLDNYTDSLPVGECVDDRESRKRAARLREIFCREIHMLVEEGETLRFLHQDFRDFFSAVHVLNEAEVSIRKKEIPVVLKERILDYYVRRFMGEIEREHRCKPYLVKGEGWKININKEIRMHKVLDLCRGKFGAEVVGYAVFNIVTTWKEARGELTGVDLSGLDLSGISLNGVRCNRFYDNGDGRSCRYLDAVFDGSLVHEKNLWPQGHTGEVTSAVYSPDGKKILSASFDQTIKEWDAGTGECVKTLAGHQHVVTSAEYSADGKKILSSSFDATIKEWNAKTGQCLKTHIKSDIPDLSEYPTASANTKLRTSGNIISAQVAQEKGKVMRWINIPGLFIQGCSFKSLGKGSEWTEEGLKTLRQYGAKL